MVEVEDKHSYLAYLSDRLDGNTVLVQAEMGSPSVCSRIEEADQLSCLPYKRSDVAPLVSIA